MTGREKRKQQAKFWGLTENLYIRIVRAYNRFKRQNDIDKKDFDERAKTFTDGEEFREYMSVLIKKYHDFKSEISRIYVEAMGSEREDIIDRDDRARYALLYYLLSIILDEDVSNEGRYSEIGNKVDEQFCKKHETLPPPDNLEFI